MDIKKIDDKLCQRLKIADGSATTFPKCSSDNAIPNPEFCIPTSIAIVLLTSSGNLSKEAVEYPTKSPNKLWRMTTTKNMNVILSNKSEERAKIIPIISAINISDNFGKNFKKGSIFDLNNLLRINPSSIGNITIQNVDFIKLSVLISITSFA